MATGWLHLNGANYELATPMDDYALSQLAERVRPASELSAEEKRLAGFAGSSAITQTVDVVVNGARAALAIRRDRIWASGAWLVDDPAPPQIF